jgi:hypothetical protein
MRAARIGDVPAGLHPAAEVADQHARQVGVPVQIAVAHAAAVHQHALVEQRAVAVGRGLHLLGEAREKRHVVRVDLGFLLDEPGIVAVMRDRMASRPTSPSASPRSATMNGNSGAMIQRSRPTSPKPSPSRATAFHSYEVSHSVLAEDRSAGMSCPAFFVVIGASSHETGQRAPRRSPPARRRRRTRI